MARSGPRAQRAGWVTRPTTLRRDSGRQAATPAEHVWCVELYVCVKCPSWCGQEVEEQTEDEEECIVM